VCEEPRPSHRLSAESTFRLSQPADPASASGNVGTERRRFENRDHQGHIAIATKPRPVGASVKHELGEKLSRSTGFAQFLRMALPFRGRLLLGLLAMLTDAALTVMRPWPLKVVIDRVISHTSRPTRVPFLGSWLDGSGMDRMSILYGACAATLLIAL